MSQDQDRQARRKVTDFFRQAPGRYLVFSAVLGIVILIPIIWFLPYWQVPKSGLSIKDRLHQINEYRKTLAQIFGGGFLALVGLYIAWVRSKALQDQAEVAREQQLRDLYVKAVEQLGSEKLQIRLGGIYALERIARESAKDHWPIMEVLTAFVRVNAPRQWDDLSGQQPMEDDVSPSPLSKPRTDIQAVITVLGRRVRTFGQGEEQSLDLRETHLAGLHMEEAKLQGMLFNRANLRNSLFINANLEGAHLLETDLQKAFLLGCNLRESVLDRADLRKAYLVNTILQGSLLINANFQEATLDGVDLQGAHFNGAKLNGSDLKGAIGITPEQVANAIWDETTKWPEGFSPPPRPQKEEEK
ncbi:MAG: pentapeptide repeat-containing protein [Thermodesulfobacteriota bacterium]